MSNREFSALIKSTTQRILTLSVADRITGKVVYKTTSTGTTNEMNKFRTEQQERLSRDFPKEHYWHFATWEEVEVPVA